MLSKKNRINTKEVDKIFQKSNSLNSLSLAFKYFKNEGKETKISFIAPKNLAKLAVKRNLLRRLGYFALEKNIKLFPAGITGIFVFKKYQDNIAILENEIKNIFGKVN